MAHVFTDHLGRLCHIPYPPQRIISLCPSITETLVKLGAGPRLVGRTRFCIHPNDDVATIAKVGGTKSVKYDKIERLQPDLIIAEKEENTLPMIEQLESKYPVYVTDVNNLEEGYRLILDVGKLIGAEDKASEMEQEARNSINRSGKISRNLGSVLYLIWKEPWMVAGQNTFIHDVLTHAGFNNLGQQLLTSRYPEVTKEIIEQLNPDWIMLSSEPYRFKTKHLEEINDWLPRSRVILVEGEMFSWYGSRMILAGDYLLSLQNSCTSY